MTTRPTRRSPTYRRQLAETTAEEAEEGVSEEKTTAPAVGGDSLVGLGQGVLPA